MDKLSELLLKTVRPATKEELREQGENLAKNYEPGPRQVVPFLPTEEARLKQEWECFRDLAYYDMWCVRKVGERRFEFGYHISSEGEARALCEELATLRADRTKAAEELADVVFVYQCSECAWIGNPSNIGQPCRACSKGKCIRFATSVEAEHRSVRDSNRINELASQLKASQSELVRERERHQELRPAVVTSDAGVVEGIFTTYEAALTWAKKHQMGTPNIRGGVPFHDVQFPPSSLEPKAEPAPVATGEKLV